MKEHLYDLWFDLNEPFSADTTFGLCCGFISIGLVFVGVMVIAAIGR